MKKTILGGLSILLMSVAFVGCSNEVSVDENYAHKKKVMEYDAAFEQEFGKIAEGHNWGFDQTAGARTRGADVSSFVGWEIPTDLTSSKEGWSKSLQAALENSTLTTINVDFKNYWLQHAAKAMHHKNMKKLQAYDSSANNGAGGWIDVINFKDGDNTVENKSYLNTKLKGTTLMKDMGGSGDPANNNKMFRWLGSDNNYYYDYKFCQYNGMYFLGLYNYISNKPDYWVIAIAQANKAEDELKEEGRVLCEDMGTVGDFDFNDVVFDVQIFESGKIVIDIKAAGGTLPITVAGEAVALGEMTNTGVKDADKTQQITIDAETAKTNKWFTIKDIPVVVYPAGDSAIPYELVAEPGKAPQKICTCRGVYWPDEYVSIKDAYVDFEDWVKNNPQPATWDENRVEKFTNLILEDNKD